MNIENIERIQNEIILLMIKNPPLESLNGLMGAFTHMIHSCYKDKEQRRVTLKCIHDSILENIESLEEKGILKENHKGGVIRKEFIY